MKVLIHQFIVCIVSVVVLSTSSCSRKDPDYIGPARAYAPSDFVVEEFTASKPSADFTVEDIVFNAKFSHSVSWVFTIEGKISGAKRVFTGLSDHLTDVIWNGGHNDVIFFREGEPVAATLSFFGSKFTSTIDLTVTKKRDFSTYGTVALFGDFETPLKVAQPNWAAFNVGEQGVDSVAVDYKGKKIKAIEGKNYYYIKGLGEQSVFVDGIQYIGRLRPKLPADANEVWFNIYLYGTGDANTKIDIELQESDKDGGLGGYQGTDDDAFVKSITLDHKGWKLFSFKYSDTTPSANLEFGGSGNHIHESDRLMSWGLILLKQSNPDSPVEVYFDYPIITVGAPFNTAL